MVVTNELREAMIAGGFCGVTFRAVEKAHIVEIPYHRWNWTAHEPRYYPHDSEPESFLDPSHSEQVSRQIGELWEAVIAPGVEVHRSPKLDLFGHYEFRAYRETRNDVDLFSDSNSLNIYCSLRAKNWFEKHVPGWTHFELVAFTAEGRPPAPLSMAEDAAFVLFAAKSGLIDLGDIRRWASSKTFLPSASSQWIVTLSSPSLPSNDDAIELLEEHAAPLSFRRKLQVMLYASSKRRLSFAAVLPKLHRIAVANQTSVSPEDAPLTSALTEWNAGESSQTLSEARISELQRIGQTYLEDTPDLEILFRR